MEADEVVQMLRHARHDWMNQLQLVQGYATMDKMERVKEKLNEIMVNADEERRLMNINAPYLTLWLMSFNWKHPYMRLTYQINVDTGNLEDQDITLYAYCQEVIRVYEQFSDKDTLYRGMVSLASTTKNQLGLSITFEGSFSDTALLKEKLNEKEFVHLVEINKLEKYHQVTAKMNVEVKR